MIRRALPFIESVLIVGGCGFLGRYIVKELLKHPEHPKVYVLDQDATRNIHPSVMYFEADITSYDEVRALLGILKPRVIIHTASILPKYASEKPDNVSLFKKINIDGTANLLRCAELERSVAVFIYTSTVAVAALDPRGEAHYLDETAPLLEKVDKNNPYPGTKAIADKLVLEANNNNDHVHNGLRTCTLRLANLYGPGDINGVWPILQRLKSGEHIYQVGDNKAFWDFLYVENAAFAHVRAIAALLLEIVQPSAKGVAGEAFILTDEVPITYWNFCRKVWEAADYNKSLEERKVIPKSTILRCATLTEWAYWLKPFGRKQSKTRRAAIEWTWLNRTYSSEKANERFGYSARISMDDGVKRAVEWGMREMAPEGKDG